MRIDAISITPLLSSTGSKTWVLQIDSAGHRFTGGFDNLWSFMHAVGDAIKYFGQAHGVLRKNEKGELVNVRKQ